MPDYVDRCGEQVFCPPFAATLADFYGFVVQADHAVLNTNICDRFFNDPLGTPKRFSALQYVIFVFNAIQDARSLNPAYQDRGRFSYNEAAIWMVIADNKDPIKLRWFQPYIFVDNPYALMPGREIYGWPKTMGEIYVQPGSTVPPYDMWIKTEIVQQSGGRGERKRLFEVRPSIPISELRQWTPMRTFELLLVGLGITPEYFEQFGIPTEIGKQFIESFVAGSIPFIFCKQFRDGTDPQKAMSLSVQEAESHVTDIHQAGIFEFPYDVAVADVYSHPILNDLGLENGPDGYLQSKLSFWMSLDFEIGACTSIS